MFRMGSDEPIRRREFLSRLAVLGGMGGVAFTTRRLLAEHAAVRAGKWRIGHHFWNWDHAWNTGEFLDRRLQMTKETGYEGFEAKPAEIGRPPQEVRAKCTALGIACAAIG